MYASFFSLNKPPFGMTADPAFLFLTPQHREALAALLYGITQRKGFLLLSGDAGTGKTTLLTALLRKLSSTTAKPSVILNPMLTADEFLELTMLDFGIEDVPQSKAQRLRRFQKFLLDTECEGRVAVLIVDEAHKLTHDVLEALRLLGNFEHPERKLLQIVLAGQSEIDETLTARGLWQLKQRISIRVETKALDRSTLDFYIRHRWSVAGGGETIPFPVATMDSIYQWSQGIPRLVNSLCDNSLVLAFAENSSVIVPAHVATAAADLCLTGTAKREPPTAPLGPRRPQVEIEEDQSHHRRGATDSSPAPGRRIPPAESSGFAAIDRINDSASAPKLSLFARWLGKLRLA